MKVTPDELRQRVAWPLDLKLEYFCKIVSQFIIHTRGGAYMSFSGGKDSKVGVDIVDKIYDGTFKHITPNWDRLVSFPKPVKLFSNTGLEFPEIVDYVKEHDNVVIVKPKMGFTRVIKEVGVAVGSKMIAEMVSRLKGYISNPSDKNAATKRLYMQGIRKDGTESKGSKLSEKWKYLIDAPFNVSGKCCDILKKEPFESYHKETGKHPIVFTTVGEGAIRKTSYFKTGCNTFTDGKEKSRPLSIFTEADIWEYAARFKIRFAEVYYEREIPVEQVDGSIKVTKIEAESRTGCMFCMFGIHLEDKKKNNRIQRIAISHPKMHDVIINKSGLGEVLKYIKVPYMPMTGCGSQIHLFGE